MIYLAAACVAGWTASVSALVGLLRGQQRAHARREDLLLNQLLHAVGRPWQPAPADEPEPAPVDDGTAPAYVIAGYTDDF